MNEPTGEKVTCLICPASAGMQIRTAKGYPDISLQEPIAKVFDISVTELPSGNAVKNVNISANMMHSKFYVCPVCGNIIHCMGEAVIQCHGVQLSPCQAEETDENALHIFRCSCFGR